MIKVDRDHVSGNRYAFDFGPCNYLKGWAQIDSDQDASYFGTWANPARKQVVQFTEGDLTITTADTDAEFTAEVIRIKEWNILNGFTFAIDGMCRPEIIEGFRAIGLAHELC